MKKELFIGIFLIYLVSGPITAQAGIVDCSTNRSNTWVFETTITTTDSSVTSCNTDSFFSKGISSNEAAGSDLLEASIATTVAADGITWSCTTTSKSMLALEASCTSNSSTMTDLTINGVNLENLGRPTDCPCVTGPVPLYSKEEFPNPHICWGTVIQSGAKSITASYDTGIVEPDSSVEYSCALEVAGYEVSKPTGTITKEQSAACDTYATALKHYYKPVCDLKYCEDCEFPPSD